MSDKTPSVFRSIKNDIESRSDLPILHALVNPAIQAVAICAEYQTDIPALITKRKGTEKDKPGIYPHALDHSSLKELIRNSFDISPDEF